MALNEVFACDLCLKAFDTLGRYNQHLKTHSKPFQCQICPKSFALRADLTRHVRARHESGQGRHACIVEDCGFKATRRDNVKQHIRKKHPEIAFNSGSHRKTVRRRHDWSPLPSHSLGAPCMLQSEQTLAGSSTLMSAARVGNQNLVQRLLQLGIDVSAKADDKSTALHCAARANQHEMAQFLVQAGAELDSMNDRRRTPLHEAILGRSKDVFSILLHRGAKITECALRDMLEAQQIEMFERFIAHYGKAIIEMHGTKMFHFAAKGLRTTIMARFLSIPEVTPDWIATNGAAVIYRVISMGQTIMFRCLLESTKLDPNAPIDQYQCIIRLAAAKGQGELIRLLLESNTIDLDLFRNRSLKILRTAAARGHYKVVEILLQFPDTTVAEYDKYGGGPSNALHLACINGHPEVVKLLLQAFDERKLPVDIEAIDLKCLTPLEVAVNYGALEVVKLLLSRPDIDFNERKNCPNSWGNIPIWRKGVKSGRAGILTLLLDNVRTDSGQVHDCRESLLGLAASLLHWSVVNVLLNYTDSSPLSSTQQGGTLPQESPTEAFDVMRRLFHDKRFLQYSKDAMGRNLWNIAARTGNTDLASTLLKFVQEQQASEHPAIDVNRYENYGHTPLHTAVRNNRIDIVKLMLQHKDLDINLRTRDHSKPGKSALDIAIHNRGLKALQKLSSKEKCSSIIEILLAHGAQSYQNRDGHHFPTPHQGYVQEPAPHANATWASIAGIERNEMAKEDLSKEAEEVMDDTDSMEEDALLIDDDAMFDDWMNFDDGDT